MQLMHSCPAVLATVPLTRKGHEPRHEDLVREVCQGGKLNMLRCILQRELLAAPKQAEGDAGLPDSALVAVAG